jgi:intracellular sulfur oxidation DsrE/DsrF family protein
MKMSKMVSAVSMAVAIVGLTSVAHASDVTCPVGLVSGLTLSYEFGDAVAADTRCIQKRHEVKTMFAINQFTTNDEDKPASPDGTGGSISGGPYALNQIQNVYNDYTITAGMSPKDFSMIAVVHGGGGFLLLNDPNINPFIAKVKNLMAEGVQFYFCENTVRGFMRAGYLKEGDVAAGVIPGVHFVTAGLAAMSDFESEGYSYVEP